jgi:hypothetical protein
MRSSWLLRGDRRLLRRGVALACLILAACSLGAAGVSLAGPTGSPLAAGRGPGILLPAIAVSFLVVLAAVVRGRGTVSAPRRPVRHPAAETFRKSA